MKRWKDERKPAVILIEMMREIVLRLRSWFEHCWYQQVNPLGLVGEERRMKPQLAFCSTSRPPSSLEALRRCCC